MFTWILIYSCIHRAASDFPLIWNVTWISCSKGEQFGTTGYLPRETFVQGFSCLNSKVSQFFKRTRYQQLRSFSVRNKKTPTFKADSFAVGVTIFYMIFGHLPYESCDDRLDDTVQQTIDVSCSKLLHRVTIQFLSTNRSPFSVIVEVSIV